MTDTGARCERHVGGLFPVRCVDCEREAAAIEMDERASRLGYIPGTECRLHANYPLPCAACARIARGEV